MGHSLPSEDFLSVISLFKKEGDQRAFKMIFDKYFPTILNIAYRFLNNKEEAEEVTADCFFKLWLYRERYSLDTEAGLVRFLVTVVRRDSIDARRKRKTRKYIHTVTLIEEITRVEDPFSIDLERPVPTEKILSIIDQLPPRSKAAFLLCLEGNKLWSEIADELGTTLQVAQNLNQRAKKMIRKQLAK